MSDKEKVTFKPGKRSRNELYLPALRFVVADDWIDKLGETAFVAWLKMHTWVDRSDADRDYDKVPYTLESTWEKLGMSKSKFYTKVIRPLWDYGLIDIVEYEESNRKSQKPKNIIVYTCPFNQHELEVKPLEKLRDYDKDYQSSSQVFGKKGGRPANSHPLKDNPQYPQYPQEGLGDKPNNQGDHDRFKNKTVGLDGFKNKTVTVSKLKRSTVLKIKRSTVSKLKPNNVSNKLTNITNKPNNKTNKGINVSNNPSINQSKGKTDGLTDETKKQISRIQRAFKLHLGIVPSESGVVSWLKLADPITVQSTAITIAEGIEEGLIVPPINNIYRYVEKMLRQGYQPALGVSEIPQDENDLKVQGLPW